MENIDAYYTSNLSEKIYHANDSSNSNLIKDELDNFFSELISRKRYDSKEGGVQACMVLFPDKFAAKIAENDGLSGHGVTNINLVEYLNNKKKYLIDSGYSYYHLSKEEKRELYDAMQLRIIDNPNELKIAITSSIDIKSVFQLKVMKYIILLCKDLMDNKVYKNVRIGLSTPNTKIEFENWSSGRENLFFDNLDRAGRIL